MTLPVEFTDAIKAWVAKHVKNPVACTKQNGRTELVDLYLLLVESVTRDKAITRVGAQIRKYRGIISPEKTNPGWVKKEKGENTSKHSDEMKVSNAIHNPINNAFWNPVKKSNQQPNCRRKA